MTERLKSAYELALERLQKQDRASGVEAPKALTKKQKERIAELRRQGQAKRAEIEILWKPRLAEAAATGEAEKVREARERYETDLRRVESWLESALAEVRS